MPAQHKSTPLVLYGSFHTGNHSQGFPCGRTFQGKICNEAQKSYENSGNKALASLTEENSLLLRADLKVHPEGHLLATVSKSAKGFNGGKKISFGALAKNTYLKLNKLCYTVDSRFSKVFRSIPNFRFFAENGNKMVKESLLRILSLNRKSTVLEKKLASRSSSVNSGTLAFYKNSPR